MSYTQEDLDKVLNKFIESDLNKMSNYEMNRLITNHSKTDFLTLKPELVAELAKPFISHTQMKNFKGENEKQIRAAGNLIMCGKMPRPEWFLDINDYKGRVANIDHKARAAKVDWKKVRKESATKIDWKARSKKFEKSISQFDLQGNFIKDWSSATIAGQELGIEFTSISKCCRGKGKTAGGFIWKFKSEQN
jgi:hypothetical protein